MEEQIVFGDEMMPITLPDDVQSAPPGLSTTLSAADNIEATVRQALQKPIGRPLISETARPNWKVTIAFDDPTVPCFAPVWEPAIRLVIEELEKAGLKRSNITLLCANALHRKFTRGELAGIIGKDLVKEFGYRLVCHDAEDFDNMTYLGTTESGYEVEINKLVTDSDLTVYVNTVVWRGFNGGWKSVCVGLGSYRSIRWHHTPDGMSMNKNRMHEILDEMGAVIETRIGKERIFKIETALANPLEVHKVWTGGVAETRQAVLTLMKSQLKPRREIVNEKEIIRTFELIDEQGNYYRYSPDTATLPLTRLFDRTLATVTGTVQCCRTALDHNFCFAFSGGMHHAQHSHGAGFCPINDIVIAIRKLQAENRIRTVWVIDTDAHKGDGTAALTRGDDSITTLSIHMAHGWPLDGEKYDRAGNLNPSFIDSDIDIAMARGEDHLYVSRLQEGLNKLDKFSRPDLTVVVSGVDPFEKDELPSTADLKLTLAQMKQRDLLVYGFLKERKIPGAYLMAGGYGESSWQVYAQFLEWALLDNLNMDSKA